MLAVSTPSSSMVPALMSISLSSNGAWSKGEDAQQRIAARLERDGRWQCQRDANSTTNNTPTNLKSVSMRELLPLPVRPTTPQLVPAGRLCAT